MKKKPTIKPQSSKATLVCFLLDRSGSMISCRDEVISGFNAYIKDLRKDLPESSRFTLTQFDSAGIDVLHNSVPLKKVMTLNTENYQPRAGTPLYDAIGKTIRATETESKQFKVLFVIQTDGQENSSSEWNKDTIKTLIKDKEDESNWTFAYMGMGPDGWAATQAIAFGTQSVSNVMKTTGKNSIKAMRAMSRATRNYSHSASGQCVATNFYAGNEDQT